MISNKLIGFIGGLTMGAIIMYWFCTSSFRNKLISNKNKLTSTKTKIIAYIMFTFWA